MNVFRTLDVFKIFKNGESFRLRTERSGNVRLNVAMACVVAVLVAVAGWSVYVLLVDGVQPNVSRLQTLASQVHSSDAKVTNQQNQVHLPSESAALNSQAEAEALAAFKQFKLAPPTYLKGTDLRGGFPLDPSGNLIVHPMIKARFDYFLLMVEDVSYEQILSIIRGNILSELTGPAQNDALKILNGYSAYLQDYNALTLQAGSQLADVNALITEIHAMRTRHLGSEVTDAFFLTEAWLQQRALNGSEQPIMYDDDRTAQANKNFVTQWQAGQKQTLRLVAAQQKQQKILGDTPSAEQLYDFRKTEFGAAAASRLTQLDQARARFQQHVAWVKQQRKQNDSNGLSQQDNDLRLREDLVTQFGLSPLEIKRIFVVADLN